MEITEQPVPKASIHRLLIAIQTGESGAADVGRRAGAAGRRWIPSGVDSPSRLGDLEIPFGIVAGELVGEGGVTDLAVHGHDVAGHAGGDLLPDGVARQSRLGTSQSPTNTPSRSAADMLEVGCPDPRRRTGANRINTQLLGKLTHKIKADVGLGDA
jgi:hypothetical protein